MLPQFPKFKKLELSDKDDIEAMTSKFPPYSDFNFTSLWSWDIKGKTRISRLNDNFIVRFNDYISSKQFYSFIGKNDVDETAKKLLTLAKKEKFEQKLKLIPEETAKKLDREIFLVSEDRDNHDYVIPIQIFKDYNTKETRAKRQSVKQFLKNFSPTVKQLNIHDGTVKNHILGVFDKWSRNKNTDPLQVKNELLAIQRLLETKYNHGTICTGAYVGSDLISFCVSEPLNGHYSSIHFCKADTSISPGTYSHILQQNAHILGSKKRSLINIEQDLGIENIRKWKTSHGEHMFLKKFTVEYNKDWII